MQAVAPMTFADLRAGMSARVVRVDEDCLESLRLQEMGFTVGATFQVLKVAPLGDPVEVQVRGYRVCLRKNECRCIEIEPLS
ncbi:MAG: FeoA family protein [Fimbriimonadaceae bacterium]|nr:FeoA family protein [Fimbriimonadaceae bacterium]